MLPTRQSNWESAVDRFNDLVMQIENPHVLRSWTLKLIESCFELVQSRSQFRVRCRFHPSTRHKIKSHIPASLRTLHIDPTALEIRYGTKPICRHKTRVVSSTDNLNEYRIVVPYPNLKSISTNEAYSIVNISRGMNRNSIGRCFLRKASCTAFDPFNSPIHSAADAPSQHDQTSHERNGPSTLLRRRSHPLVAAKVASHFLLSSLSFGTSTVYKIVSSFSRGARKPI